MSIFDRAAASCLPLVPRPVVRFFARPYIAGDRLADAVRVVKGLNEKGMCATIDVLGEDIKRKEEALEAAAMYREVLREIDAQNLDANISLKPTQMGLKLDRDFCQETIGELVRSAAEVGNFVRIDMEDSTCTTDTIEIYLKLREKYANVGTVIQACLRRSLQDIRRLLKVNPNLRLCKGIYIEPRSIAYRDKEIVNYNFILLLDELLRNGSYVGIATHDEKLVWHALRIIEELKLTCDKYEFQMLLGVQEELRDIIVRSGHKLRVYVPFGRQWHAYCTRRLKENPQICGHIIRDIFHLG